MLEERTLISQTPDKVGETVVLYGWVNSCRDHGQVMFVDLRDRSGVVQTVAQPALFGSLKKESVVRLEGEIKSRPANMVNEKLATGKIELQVTDCQVINEARDLPFGTQGQGKKIAENLRLDYRYLDLRRPRLQQNIRLRHEMMQQFRRQLTKRKFWEIDTPNLSKSTPEGARDFLVPSRLQPGKFYALPQSPQQYKQLLMVAGIEKYFQLAHCFRDEDLRADRGLEFRQVDIEMSFVEREDVLNLVEEVMIAVVEGLGRSVTTPFPRLTYQEAMEKYDTDKPDLRADKSDSSELAFAWVIDFPLFERTATRGITPMHHPFTSPNPADLDLLDKKPLQVRSWQYDLVCNGEEVGGGSVRITDPAIQTKIFEILGHDRTEVRERFGHLLEAFEYGVPPHGGIALGFDRLVAVLAGEKSIREVIAFPCNSSGEAAVMDAPSRVDKEQLEELGIKVIAERDENEED